MKKRIISMVILVAVFLSVTSVVMAEVTPPCGHSKYTKKYMHVTYAYLNQKYHTVYSDVEVTCDVCGKTSTGREVSTAPHNDRTKYDYHSPTSSEHIFKVICSHCNAQVKMATITCFGEPHVSAPW